MGKALAKERWVKERTCTAHPIGAWWLTALGAGLILSLIHI